MSRAVNTIAKLLSALGLWLVTSAIMFAVSGVLAFAVTLMCLGILYLAELRLSHPALLWLTLTVLVWGVQEIIVTARVVKIGKDNKKFMEDNLR